MSDAVSGCACPRIGARDCIRVRTGLDLREMLGEELHPVDAEEVCECSCHTDGADEDPEW